VVATADEGGDNAILPIGYVPDGGMDPLNPAAVEDFWNAGPQATPPILPRWVGQAVQAPVTYWVLVPGTQWSYVLTGLGANRGPAQIGSTAQSANRPYGSIGNP
jgi:hypothetical protein